MKDCYPPSPVYTPSFEEDTPTLVNNLVSKAAPVAKENKEEDTKEDKGEDKEDRMQMDKDSVKDTDNDDYLDSDYIY